VKAQSDLNLRDSLDLPCVSINTRIQLGRVVGVQVNHSAFWPSLKPRKKMKPSKTIEFNGVEITCHGDGSVEWEQRREGGKPHRTFGCIRPDRRLIVSIGRKRILAHRLQAMANLSDYSEELQVDHINGDPSDNRPTNLRMTTDIGNKQGFMRKREGCSSARRGVCWDKDRVKYRAYIRVNSKLTHLGLFSDEDDAGRAYDSAAVEHGYQREALNFPDEHPGSTSGQGAKSPSEERSNLSS